MGFFSSIKKFFGTTDENVASADAQAPAQESAEASVAPAAIEEPDGTGEAEGKSSAETAPEVPAAGEDTQEAGDACALAEEPALAGAREDESPEEIVEYVDEVPAAPVPAADEEPEIVPIDEEASAIPAQPEPEKKGFFASLKKMFGGGGAEPAARRPIHAAGESGADVAASSPAPATDTGEAGMLLRLRNAPPRLSAWLDIILEGVDGAGPLLDSRVLFLLRSLDAPADEAQAFVADFSSWLERMEYRQLDEFRSELQYRLAIALDLEDEEDERSQLLLKLTRGLAKTRESLSRGLEGLFAGHGELDEAFWEELEELFIVADLGYEAAIGLVGRLRERARAEGVTTTEGVRGLLHDEIRSIFAQPRRIQAVTPPEVVLMIGVNGAGKTTTIAKLAYRDKMQGRKVMIAAADTFRAAAIDQMRVWSERVGTLFHAKQPGADPASVAYEAVTRALEEGVDVLYVDTAGRLQTKVNLMDELAKIRQVIGKRHPGAPHRTVLVLDATTGQNALSQVKLFRESAGVDELVLTKLDGTAKGGVAIAVAMQYGLPISFVGLGEKVEDLRPFNGDDYADILLKSA